MKDNSFCRLLCFSLILFFLPVGYGQAAYYTVTLPEKLHANSDYVVAITYHGSPAGDVLKAPLDIKVNVQSNNDNAGTITSENKISVEPGSTKQLVIEIGDWPSGNYQVLVTGSGPIDFSSAEYFYLDSKSFFTLIQTDKGMYLPSQLVLFRIIIMDPNLIPYQEEPLMVQIKDPQDNIIQQWTDAELDRGVFQGELQLSEQPVMGDWSIIAQVGSDNSDVSKMTTVKVTVQEYVLPRFEVTVDTPYATFVESDKPFAITVNAKYTFGGQVKGDLDLSVTMANCPYPEPYYPYYWYDDVIDDSWRYNQQTTCTIEPVTFKVTLINGTATIPVMASSLYKRTTSELPLPPVYEALEDRSYDDDKIEFDRREALQPARGERHRLERRRIYRPFPIDIISSEDTIMDTHVNIVATVTEALTGIQMNTTATMTIYAKDKQLSMLTPTEFKPGMTFPVTVKLTRGDGQPLVNSGGEVSLMTNYGSFPLSNYTQTTLLSASGVAVFSVEAPRTAQHLYFTAYYKNMTIDSDIAAAKSINGKFISVNVTTVDPKVGDDIEFEVRTSFPMESPLSFVMVGRGNVLASGTPTVSGLSATFSVPATILMAPVAHIVVYYIDTSYGDMIADSLDVNIAGLFRTPLSVTTSANQLKPGDNVTLTVNTLGGSLVGLSSVDNSVLLLNAGNDITKEKVFDELQKYEVGNSFPYDDTFDIGFRRGFNYGQSFQQIFAKAGLALVTNGQYYTDPEIMYRPTFLYKGGMNEELNDEFGGVLEMEMAMNDVVDKEDMMAAPAAEDSMLDINTSTITVEPTRVRTYFPETFIFSKTNITDDGQILVTYTVPDTITTWSIKAFAMNNEYGMGIMDQPSHITVIRSFFMALNLPYSVVRNEIIKLTVLVFNYQDQDSQVTVTLSNPKNEFKIIGQDENANPNQITITQLAAANAPTAFNFTIQPKIVGLIPLIVNATSPTAGDALINQLLVKAEGTTEFFNEAVLIDLRNSSTFSSQVKIDIPPSAIEGSEFIEFSTMGDIMGPALNNIKELIRMPTGCGEQNMISFVPDVVVMKYLQSTDSLTSDVKDTLLKYLVQGYQRELTYRHKDGSYSAFGESDEYGSTWLTAFVLRSFLLAKPYITIDDNILSLAKNFLVNHQGGDGEFIEKGNIIHTTLQGGSASGVGLTAFCLIAFLEDETQDNAQYQSAIDKGVEYLEKYLEEMDSVYDISIVTYALQLSKSSTKRDKAFELLQTKRTPSGDFAFWQSSVTKPSGTYSYYEAPTSYDIEATSYALLCYAKRGVIVNILPIIRWLISKRNSLGGYSSTQDTVMGIQALATAGSSFKGKSDSTVDIAITYNGGSHNYTLNKENALVTQKTPLPKDVRIVNIEAKGSGVAIIQLSWQYNVFILDPLQSFQVDTTVTSDEGQGIYTLQVCAKYLGADTTSMVLFEVNTLSGYKWDEGSLPAVGDGDLKRRDLTKGGTQVTLYFQPLPAGSPCISLNAISSDEISNLQDAIVSVYDYYNTFKKGEARYNLSK